MRCYFRAFTHSDSRPSEAKGMFSPELIEGIRTQVLHKLEGLNPNVGGVPVAPKVLLALLATYEWREAAFTELASSAEHEDWLEANGTGGYDSSSGYDARTGRPVNVPGYARGGLTMDGQPSTKYLGKRGEWGVVRWQAGPVANGRNGMFVEEMLEEVIIPKLALTQRDRVPDPRLEGEWMPNPFRNAQTDRALKHLRTALVLLKDRVTRRVEAGVSGKYEAVK